MKILDFYRSTDILECLKRYLSPEQTERLFGKHAADLASDRCPIALFGKQGVGKSSFLNALLFDDVILPVAVSETTCVPTKITYGESPTLRAWVVRGDSRTELPSCTAADLEKYVHQQYNAANRQGIDYVEIQSNDALLKHGIDLIDLPGFGSMTDENQKCARTFAEQSACTILMMRLNSLTVGHERSMFQVVCPMFGKIIPVFNRWCRESPAEAEQCLPLLKSQLSLLADESGCRIEDLSMLCVEDARNARVADDSALLEKSGLTEFRKRLINFCDNWKITIQAACSEKAKKLLKKAGSLAAEHQTLLSGERSAADAEAEKTRTEGLEQLDKCRTETNALLKELDQLCTQQSQLLSQTIQEICESVRTDVRLLIKKGVTDASRLKSAFQDYVAKHSSKLAEACQSDVQKEIRKKTGHLGTVIQEGLLADTPEFSAVFSERSQIHAQAGHLGGIAGGLIALALLSNPIGWAAAGIMLGAGIAGEIVGKGVEGAINSKQKSKAEQELDDNIDRFKKGAETQYFQAMNKYRASLRQNVNEWFNQKEDAITADYEAKIHAIQLPLRDKEALEKQIATDIASMNNWLKMLEE